MVGYNIYIVLTKIKNYIEKARNNPELRDPRTLGLVVIGVVALSVAWSSTQAIMQIMSC